MKDSREMEDKMKSCKTKINSRNVLATINYSKSLSLNSSTEKWFMDTVSCPNGTKICNFEDDSHMTVIHDLRGLEDQVDLDQNGFQAIVSPTSVNASLLLSGHHDTITKLYYPEIEKLIVQVTGACRVIFFDHTIRHNNSNSDQGNPNSRPVLRVHVDQTPTSALARLTRHNVDENLPFKRFQILNVWRPIGNTVFDYPLALADFRSLDLDRDLVVTETRYPPWLKDKETYAVKWNSKHKWYYWSGMTPDEVLILKCFDSASKRLASVNGITPLNEEGCLLPLGDDISGLCPHTAFLDEEGALEGISRQSIEVRALVFYD